MTTKYFVAIFLIFTCIFTLFTIPTTSLPFVLFHGIADECSSERLQNVTATLSTWSGAQGTCLEIGNGYLDSFFMPIEKQVKNYIALAGPHAGIASPPLCHETDTCVLEADLIKLGVYTPFVQERLAPAGYIKIPTDIDGYMKGCGFLPKLNNEIEGQRNAIYKKRFASLQQLVLIKFEQDSTLVPRETSWFGHYEDGSWNTILPVQQTKLYTEDWIGLRTLDEAGKVKFVNVTGDHLEISFSDMQKYVFPYLL